MRRLSVCGSLAVAALAVAGSACSSDPSSNPTNPSNPTEITESFTGTLTVNGAVTFPYFVTLAGDTTATIKDVDPDAFVVLHENGTGVFAVGERIYQGESLDTATWTATVVSWNPATSTLTANGLTGTFVADSPVNGVDTKAVWSGKSITATVFGIALGTWSGTVCSVVLANDFAGIGDAISGVVQGAGQLCARVYDIGKLQKDTSVTVEVTHY